MFPWGRIVFPDCPGRVAGLFDRVVEAVRPEEDCLAELSGSCSRIVFPAFSDTLFDYQ